MAPDRHMTKTKTAPLSPYHRRLLVFLSVATFFEGYDFMALTQLLPNIQQEFGLSPAELGWMSGLINAGTIFAYLLVRKADVWGRRRVLTVTIVGYTLFTLFTGLTSNVVLFTTMQFFARLFLIAEWATASVYAAEEFPDDRRATMIGVIQAFSTMGGVVCAGVVPIILRTQWGWRSVYFVGVVPLILVMFARRNLRETRRFAQMSEPQDQADPQADQTGLLAVFRSPYRNRVLLLALVWTLTYMGTQNAVQFWKQFAITERGLTDGEVGASIAIAAVGAMPLVFFAGKLLDVMGRKVASAVIYCAVVIGIAGAYGLYGRWPLTAALALAIFGVSAVLPVLNNYSAELFPTEHRANAFALSNNVLGRVGYVLGPVMVGHLAADIGWGPSVITTVIFPVLGLIVVLRYFPETHGQALEESSRIQS